MSGLLDGFEPPFDYKLRRQRHRPELANPEARAPWLGEYQGPAGATFASQEFMPMGVYKQSDGSKKISWAVPRAFREDMPEIGDTTPEGQDAMGRFIFSGGLMPGTSRLAGPVPQGAVGVFGGRLAKTADHAALAKAEELAAKGTPREDIWNQTGWFQGADKKWRFEIDDSKAGWNRKAEMEGYGSILRNADPLDPAKVGKTFNHNDLYSAYPEAKKMYLKLENDPAASGGFSNRSVYIAPGLGRESSKSTMLHELQHGVQKREGFVPGANPTFGHARPDIESAARDAYNTNRKNLGRPATQEDQLFSELGFKAPDASKSWDELTPRQRLEWNDAGRDRLYRNNAGEVESRAVEKRMNLTPEERRARPPWLDYDVPEGQQIVRFDGAGPQLSVPPQAAAPAQAPARAVDSLGYYSQALEAAKNLKQAKGTPEQMLAQLKSAGVKDAEIEATGLRGLLEGRPSGTPGLDMSLEARKARAEAMGFDTSKVWYHGTRQEFDKFDLNEVAKSGEPDIAMFFSASPSVASSYAGASAKGRPRYFGYLDQAMREGSPIDALDGSRVIPSHVRLANPKVLNWAEPRSRGGNASAIHEAKSQGHDGIIFNYRSPDPAEIAVFDPRNIRSVNANFDPARAGSSNFMFSMAPLGAFYGATQNQNGLLP